MARKKKAGRSGSCNKDVAAAIAAMCRYLDTKEHCH